MKKIKVLLADDHPVFRSGLKSVIISNNELEIVGEVSNGNEAVQESLLKTPDLIIMDINMPEIDGIEATKKIKEILPTIKIIILTMYADEEFLKEGLKAGASGYILKRAVDTELLSAIKIVLNGENYIYPTLIPSLYDRSKENQDDKLLNDNLVGKLSEREKEVLKYISLGYTLQEIADELYLSIKTVDTYKSRIMEKLGTKKRSELVKYAITHNLTSRD